MKNWEKLRELMTLATKRTKTMSDVKTFINKSSFAEIGAWLETLNKTQILLIIQELSKDKDMTEELKMIEEHYSNKN